MLHVTCTSSSSSSLPAYISAFATVISVIIAAWSFWQLEKKNKQDRQIQILEKEKEQKLLKEKDARKISAWLIGRNKSGQEQIIIQNKSDTPIYNVLVVAVAVTGAATGDGEEAMKFNNSEDKSFKNYHDLKNDEWKYIPTYPFLVFQQVPPGKFIKELGLLDRAMHVSYGLEIAFSDSQENYWKIDRNGKLSEIKANYLYEKYMVENPTLWDHIDYLNDSVKNI
ncbi:hypothetical protein AABM27_01405 [Heyndrickxia faecalis]|uniref:hypothetical protein n=1 Tax=Heyndrickxia TaxID=2837504 RepID=UPI00054D96C8|nr:MULTISPECIES: hypothetical protein [Heyndrickxia]KGT40045.1 hypothetical protein P421_00200 [Heyndrickxia coagulans P38]MED4922136.1 hypothetical protein [Weizmannia sp. CD-2023]